MNSFRRSIEIFLDSLFPLCCVACERLLPRTPVRFLCDDCRSRIVPPGAFACPTCGARIPYGVMGLPPLQALCHPAAGYIVLAAGSYSALPLQKLISVLKFDRRIAAATELGELLRAVLGAAHIQVEHFIFVPVPLALGRLRSRGFNQAEEISRQIVGQNGQLRTVLVRKRETKPQTTLDNWRERRENVAGSFAMHNPTSIVGKDVVLVDDVRTTGATIEAAAQILKAAGARRVIALVAAQA